MGMCEVIFAINEFYSAYFPCSELAKMCRIKVDPLTYDSPHTKTFLLMQAHFSHLPLPNTDYLTDTKSVLDQAIRVIQVSKTEIRSALPMILFSQMQLSIGHD